MRVIHALRWGLVPGWAKDERNGPRLINARADNLDAKPAFRAADRAPLSYPRHQRPRGGGLRRVPLLGLLIACTFTGRRRASITVGI